MHGLPSQLRVRDIDEIVRSIHGEVAQVSPVEVWAKALVEAIRRHLRAAISVRLTIQDGLATRDALASAPDADADVEASAPPSSRGLVRIERVIDEELRFVLRVSYPPSQVPVFNDRDLLARLGLHLENTLRVRIRPGGVRGYIGPHGLSSVAGSELSRTAIWFDLLQGTVSLLPRPTPTGTELVLVEVGRASSSRALSEDERAVIHLFARGATSKRIGSELGLSQPVVSRCLNRAAAKMGVTSTRELLAVVSRLAPLEAPAHPAASARLTPAEREVLALVRNGLSNEAIARHRVRSNRTVANQLASLLRKTGCDSRRALASIRTVDGRGADDRVGTG